MQQSEVVMLNTFEVIHYLPCISSLLCEGFLSLGSYDAPVHWVTRPSLAFTQQ